MARPRRSASCRVTSFNPASSTVEQLATDGWRDKNAAALNRGYLHLLHYES